MKKLIIGMMMFVVVAFLTTSTFAQGTASQQITDEIINLVKAQWSAEM